METLSDRWAALWQDSCCQGCWLQELGDGAFLPPRNSNLLVSSPDVPSVMRSSLLHSKERSVKSPSSSKPARPNIMPQGKLYASWGSWVDFAWGALCVPVSCLCFSSLGWFWIGNALSEVFILLNSWKKSEEQEEVRAPENSMIIKFKYVPAMLICFCFFSVPSFALWWNKWEVETTWPTKPTVFMICLFTEKIAEPCNEEWFWWQSAPLTAHLVLRWGTCSKPTSTGGLITPEDYWHTTECDGTGSWSPNRPNYLEVIWMSFILVTFIPVVLKLERLLK